MNEIDEDKLHEFRMIEYKEASANFFKGIDIGINYSKSFLILNGVLLASAGLTQNSQQVTTLRSTLITIVIAAFGIFISALLYAIIPYYEEQLDRCGDRCAEIEKLYGGSLYTTIVTINKAETRTLTTTSTVRRITVVFALIWLIVLGARLF